MCTVKLLLLVSFAPCGLRVVHIYALRLLYIFVPYVCDMSRLASVCSYATLCIRPSGLLGYFLSNLHILTYCCPPCTSYLVSVAETVILRYTIAWIAAIVTARIESQLEWADGLIAEALLRLLSSHFLNLRAHQCFESALPKFLCLKDYRTIRITRL
jgi:hypothetical protein